MLKLRRFQGRAASVVLLTVVTALTILAPVSRAEAARTVGAVSDEPRVQPFATAEDNAGRAASLLETIRQHPPALYAFLRRLPKGGDLHTHLSGAVYAESYIATGAADGLCVDRLTLVALAPPCDAEAGRPPLSAALADAGLYGAILDAWSMRQFTPGAESGHDHFFNTFGKFSQASRLNTGGMLAEVARRAASQQERYLEIMHTPDGGAAARLGATVGWDDDLGRLQQALWAAGMAEAVAAARRNLDEAEADLRGSLHCGTPAAEPACRVVVRYLYQANRIQPRERVFAQFVLAFALAQADPRVVGLNLVAPEDNVVAMDEYEAQMRLLDFLYRQNPAMNIALHAGELTLGLVPPEGLRFHIRQAVEIGHARRIGHGVDVMYEDDPFGLLDAMVERGVLVEINLTSNDVILGVAGSQHPFPTYLQAGVPLTLSTDDEGVSRIDLTHEYQRAVETYGLRYDDLKMLSRNGLAHSFLPGENLWALSSSRDFKPAEVCRDDDPSADKPSDACREFLQRSERAQLQWQLERDFAAFERGLVPAQAIDAETNFPTGAE